MESNSSSSSTSPKIPVIVIRHYDDEETGLLLDSRIRKCSSSPKVCYYDSDMIPMKRTESLSTDAETSSQTTVSCTQVMMDSTSSDSQHIDDKDDGGSPTLWHRYQLAVDERPLLVKGITALLLMALADWVAQLVEHVRDHQPIFRLTYDLLRILRFAIFGAVGAPWTHYYYDWLDRTLPPTVDPWTTTTAIKVCIDQFLQAPALLALIIIGLDVMEGDGMSVVVDDLKTQYPSTLMANWKLWIPATVVNIAFVKPSLRVLFDNVVFLVWTVFLSIMLNTDTHQNAAD